MHWTAKDQRLSRPRTSELLDRAEAGEISWENLARDALGWLSEADVEQFALSNDYIQDQEEDDESDPLDNFNYVGSRHHY